MKYDIVIVGGGMVGASLACALEHAPFRIALIDAVAQPSLHDPRLIALTYSSCNLLKNLGLWPMLKANASPIKQVHVSHRGRFGITRINSSELNLPALGHLIPAKYINAALDEKIKKLANVDVIRPATLLNINPITIQTESGTKTLHAHTIIGADGTQSTVRELLNIKTKVHDYDQSAIVTITELQRHHYNIAYERFLNHGAIAMLPLSENTCATIWTDSNENISRLMQMNDHEFLTILQKEFGYRLGRFLGTQKRHTYPLKLVLAEEYQKQNVLLIGNAAHTLHPIASQGLNLALYEIAELVDHIKNTTGEISGLSNITKRINLQQKVSTQLSHRLPWLFSTDFFVVNIARQLGMLGLDSCKQAKELFIRNTTMGQTGRTPLLLQEKDHYELQDSRH